MWDLRIAWFPNTDGSGNFGPARTISISPLETRSVFAADLDGDGDTDVLSASSFDNAISWYQNTDGAGAFGAERVITTDAYNARAVFAADLDDDGDMDVLSASLDDDKIAWYENTDGAGTFGPQQIITIEADGALSVFAADLDEDGDSDVLSASWADDTIAWYQNTDGAGHFSQRNVISAAAENARWVFAAELDGNPGTDVLSASLNDDKIAWYPNGGPEGVGDDCDN